eukprot:6947865-Prymnesium_polylepis.1
MAQSADHIGERGSGHHPRPVRGCWSQPQHFCVAASSERGSARCRRSAGLETSERVTWAMGDA